jgi:ubiquinone/menaquinone biosynthesis C-methylase UbiE
MRGVEQIPFLYDTFCTLAEWTGLWRWRERLVRGAWGRTLEVGAGTGRNLSRYGALPLLVALEPAADALSVARRRAPEVLYVRASAEALPFRPGAFDTVVSSLVFCSVPDAPRGLKEVKRVLTLQGTLRMLEHVRAESRLGGWWHDFIQPLWTRVAGGCHPNRRTEASVSAAGFTIGERRVRGTMRLLVAKPKDP